MRKFVTLLLQTKQLRLWIFIFVLLLYVLLVRLNILHFVWIHFVHLLQLHFIGVWTALDGLLS